MTKNPAKVRIEGKNAKGPGGAAQNGIAGDGVDNLLLENMKAEHPVGVGVLIFGGTGWVIKDNSILGNFLIGRHTVSDPTNSTNTAINNDNQFIDNRMGAASNDSNGTDFLNDGSGRGSCFANNDAVTLYSAADAPEAQPYPTCPATTGTATTTGDPDQLKVIAESVSQTTGQESFWHVHSHPARPGVKPFEG